MAQEYTYTQNSFAGGAIDPLMGASTQAQAYMTGLASCVNMVPSSIGYLFRRPGTRYTGLSFDGGGIGNCQVRCLDSADTPYVIVFSAGRVTLSMSALSSEAVLTEYYTGETETDEGGEETELTEAIPWLDADIPDLSIAQWQTELYIVHRNYPPLRLTNSGALGYLLEYEEADTDTISCPKTLESSAVCDSGEYEGGDGEVYLADIGKDDDWRLEKMEFTRDDAGTVPFTKARRYPGAQAFSGGRWVAGGTYLKPQTIWASRTADSDGNERHEDFTMYESLLTETVQSLVKTTVYTSAGDTSSIASVTYDSSSDNTTAGVDIDYEAPDDESSSSKVWYDEEGNVIGAVDADGNETYEDGFDDLVYKLVETTSAHTYTLSQSVYSDHAVELTESDMSNSRLLWICYGTRLMVGTRNALWMDTGSVITPEGFDLSLTLGISISSVPPVFYSNYLIYVPGDLRSVSAVYYDSDSEGYRLMEISQMARHLFTSDVRGIAVVDGRMAVLWVLLEEGAFLSCTLTNMSCGWARHELGGGGEALAITAFTPDGGGSALYLSVRRGERVCIESLALEDLVNTETHTLLDSAVTLACSSSTGAWTASGTGNYTEGDTLQTVSDGWPSGTYEYDGTCPEVDLEDASSHYAGYPYTSSFSLLRQDLPMQTANMSFGKRRKAVKSWLNLYRSGGGTYGYDGDAEEFSLVTLTGDGEESAYPSYFTGLKELDVASAAGEEPLCSVEVTEPLPLTVLSVTTKFQMKEV